MLVECGFTVVTEKNPEQAMTHFRMGTIKPVYNDHSEKHLKLVFKPNCRLMQVKSIAECSMGSILQYI